MQVKVKKVSVESFIFILRCQNGAKRVEKELNHVENFWIAVKLVQVLGKLENHSDVSLNEVG